ncbi:ATP-binding cassette domain-containing protein [Kocuria rosea]|uniref:ATP-binding cassette domain-containing protein n=1 Tax=Kocuria rosea TaxID=1275 RepID=UPI0025424B58|nr:ATP-binding cassette domain-containing protein [Kocuria rosea]WIG16904.1 ATP-binding cassette domain-containing protein [Kocuria rosea]
MSSAFQSQSAQRSRASTGAATEPLGPVTTTSRSADVADGPVAGMSHVDLTVGGDAVVALLGHNGAGKTTLLRAVVGLNRVTSGRVLLDGEDITGLSGHARVRRGMAYVPQGQRSFGGLSVRESLQVVADGWRNGRAAVDRSLAMFPALEGLLERRAGLLSGGQRQKLAIARALITEPSLLILDEATEGIQPSVVQEIEQKILQLAAGTGVRPARPRPGTCRKHPVNLAETRRPYGDDCP